MKKIFLTILVLSLAGCATSVRYFSYTNQTFPPKSQYYLVPVYSTSQHLPASQSYGIIGKVAIEGYASDGVTPDMLTEQATSIARKKGADAIINAKTEMIPYRGTYVVPGYWGYYYYHPTRYFPYENTLLEFTGDLIILKPGSSRL